jgi:hypothetical protein
LNLEPPGRWVMLSGTPERHLDWSLDLNGRERSSDEPPARLCNRCNGCSILA